MSDSTDQLAAIIERWIKSRSTPVGLNDTIDHWTLRYDRGLSGVDRLVEVTKAIRRLVNEGKIELTSNRLLRAIVPKSDAEKLVEIKRLVTETDRRYTSRSGLAEFHLAVERVLTESQ